MSTVNKELLGGGSQVFHNNYVQLLYLKYTYTLMTTFRKPCQLVTNFLSLDDKSMGGGGNCDPP